jgi:G:T-mismatch repair DNA endonuclease (very short patch repair protein)
MPRAKKSKKKLIRPYRTKKRLVARAVIRKHNAKREPSSLEREVYQMLDEEGIVYQKEKAIGNCHVDIFFPPKTAIELNGCHWHACSICHKGPPTSAQRYTMQKDANRYAYLRSTGCDLIVIWEHDVDDHPERVRAMLKGIYESTL